MSDITESAEDAARRFATRCLALDLDLTAERARADSLAVELEEYRIRLAGALVAADGGGPEHFDNPNVWESVRTCPTIAKVRQIRAERDSLTASITAACQGTGCLNAHELAEALRQARADRDLLAMEVRRRWKGGKIEGYYFADALSRAGGKE